MHPIEGVVVVELEPKEDERGSFAEVFRPEWVPDGFEVAQANLSRSHQGVVRGMHFHRRQTDYWSVVTGRAFVALADLRGHRPGTPVTIWTQEVDAAPARGLVIPPGVAHGFAALTEMALLYLVDRPFDGSDEHGFAWDDPDAAIPWPIAGPVLSTRDAEAPSLVQALDEPSRG